MTSRRRRVVAELEQGATSIRKVLATAEQKHAVATTGRTLTARQLARRIGGPESGVDPTRVAEINELMPVRGHAVKAITRMRMLNETEARITALCAIIDGDPVYFTRRVSRRRATGPKKEEIINGPSGLVGFATSDDTLTITDGAESASIEERLKAFELLAKMSGMLQPAVLDAPEVGSDGQPTARMFVVTTFE